MYLFYTNIDRIIRVIDDNDNLIAQIQANHVDTMTYANDTDGLQEYLIAERAMKPTDTLCFIH